MALTKVTSDGITDGTIIGTDLATNVDLVDNQKIRFGTGNDLSIYHDNTDSYLQNTTGTLRINNDGTDLVISTDNNIHIRTNGTEEAVKAIANGAVEIYHDNSKKFETQASGITVTGGVYSDGLICGDNDMVELGTSGDFKFYHTGSQNVIIAANAELMFQCQTFNFRNENGGENFIHATNNGAVSLYYDNSRKFSTESYGISLHGLSTGAGNSDLRYNSSTGQVTYDTSTILVKENIQAVPYGLDIVNKLQPKIYERTDDNNKIELGFIAEEMEKLIPEIVPKIKGLPVNVDYRKVCVVLTKAIQELSAKVAALEAS